MKPSVLKNKAFLYLTEFFAGMSVMAVELGASRLLAPYFSSSQIVWTIIIGGKKYEYDTLIHEIPEKGGAYVIFPWNIRKEFGKGRVKAPVTAFIW